MAPFKTAQIRRFSFRQVDVTEQVADDPQHRAPSRPSMYGNAFFMRLPANYTRVRWRCDAIAFRPIIMRRRKSSYEKIFTKI
jgi:hypothetical protein